MRLGNHQVREARERRKPLRVPLQPSIANHVAAERPYPALRRLCQSRRAAHRQRPALARVHGNVPRHFAMRSLYLLPDPAISGVRPNLFLLAVQKPVRRRQVATLAAVPSRWRASPRGPVPMCSFIPKCRWFPFLVWCVSGPRALLSFPVDDGAEMMVASTMVPSFSRTPVRPGDPRSPERQVRQSAALQPAAEVGIVVSSGTFSGLAPARRRTLSTSQAGPPSPDFRTAERSARAASLAADTAIHLLRKDLAGRLEVMFKACKGQLLKALHVVISRKKAWRKMAGAHRMHNATPKIRLYSEVP